MLKQNKKMMYHSKNTLSKTKGRFTSPFFYRLSVTNMTKKESLYTYILFIYLFFYSLYNSKNLSQIVTKLIINKLRK